MTRHVLSEEQIHPAIRSQISTYYGEVVDEVKAAISGNKTVVVGMQFNPHCRRARKILEAQNAPFEYLEFGGYTSDWRRRSTLKMWTGWPTFPMVFHDGVLIGGASELHNFVEGGGLKG